MAKFVIECPACGRFAEAKTGFFARRKIDCACGHTIDVHTDRLAGRECPHCGNMVVFDQSKREKAVCPVCHEPINTMAEQSRLEEFACGQCGVRLRASKAAGRYTCPVCDYENDVEERLMAGKIRRDGLASVIRYEGDNETLVWKHPVEDFNMGTQLIVHESQEAVFFRDGMALDLFGPGRYTLETQQLPLLEKFYQLPADAEKTFHSEVYFINLATQMGVKWGTDSKVRLFDPGSGLHLEIGASGEFNIRVTDSRRLLLKIVGTSDSLGQAELLGDGNSKGIFRALVMAQVKSYLAQAIKECGISILEIDAHLMELSHILQERLNPTLSEYGLTIQEFFVSRVIPPEDDPNYKRMKEQYAEQYLLVRQEQIRKSEAEAAAKRKAVEAQTTAQMQVIGAQGEAEALKIQRAAEVEAYRMQVAAEAEEMRVKGFTYQQETARQVGMEAMKNGIAGGEGGGLLGGIGELAGLGVGLGAMGSVMGMTKEVVEPMFGLAGQASTGMTGPDPTVGSWDCACGQTGLTGKFCPDCGARRPEKEKSWDCQCGQRGLTGKFCPECGAKRPEEPETWDCSCGQRGITSKFCPECGKKRGE